MGVKEVEFGIDRSHFRKIKNKNIQSIEWKSRGEQKKGDGPDCVCGLPKISELGLRISKLNILLLKLSTLFWPQGIERPIIHRFSLFLFPHGKCCRISLSK